MLNLIDRRGLAAFRKDLHSCRSPLGVNQCVQLHLILLYDKFGEEALQIVWEMRDSVLWKGSGVYFNPEEVPAGYDQYGVVVIADGSVETIQRCNQKVTYFGNVRLKAYAGSCQVRNTRYLVEAFNETEVFAYGDTQVMAHDFTEVFLLGRARALAGDFSRVHAYDRTYVECLNAGPHIDAHDEAQVYVNRHCSMFELHDHARGVIRTLGDDENGALFVHLFDYTLLYVHSPMPSAVAVVKHDFHGTVLRSRDMHQSPEVMADIIVPWHHRKAVNNEGALPKAVPVDELKEALVPYLPEKMRTDHQAAFQAAQDEYKVAECIARYIPRMVQKGLTGDFLRAHFTVYALDRVGIHTCYLDSGPDFDKEAPFHYFFRDQLVHASEYKGFVQGFEQALVIADNKGRKSRVWQQANGIAVDECRMSVYSMVQSIGMDMAQLDAHGDSVVEIQGNAICFAREHSRLTAYDHAELEGYDNSRIIFHDRSRGSLYDQSMGLIECCNHVSNFGQSVVGYLKGGKVSSKQIESSEDGTVKALNEAEFEQYRTSF